MLLLFFTGVVKSGRVLRAMLIGTLLSALSLGLFSHSVILPLLKNNKKQENNQRDLFCGYLLVTFTYIFIGILVLIVINIIFIHI